MNIRSTSWVISVCSCLSRSPLFESQLWVAQGPQDCGASPQPWEGMGSLYLITEVVPVCLLLRPQPLPLSFSLPCQEKPYHSYISEWPCQPPWKSAWGKGSSSSRPLFYGTCNGRLGEVIAFSALVYVPAISFWHFCCFGDITNCSRNTATMPISSSIWFVVAKSNSI